MPKPDGKLVVKWRELAEDGYLYAEISRMYPEYSVDQVRHYRLPPVLAAGPDAFGLVEHHINELIRFAHRYTVEMHHIGLGIDLGT